MSQDVTSAPKTLNNTKFQILAQDVGIEAIAMIRPCAVSIEDLKDYIEELTSKAFMQNVEFTMTLQSENTIETRFYAKATIDDIIFVYNILVGIHYKGNQIALSFGMTELVRPRKVGSSEITLKNK